MSDPRDYSYPADSACGGHPFPAWWDSHVDGEPRHERDWRHEAALYVCRRQCPVREACTADVDRRVDEGVRGGEVLPALKPAGYGAVQGTVRAPWGSKRKAS